jgi:glycosyltransferase involved in cell wall biosynthesis
MTEPARRPRLNWFSPLPPSRTEIAQYAMRSLPALAQHFDITVWTERGFAPSEIETFADARMWEGEPWPALNAADVTVYHIGNNVRFHGWIWDVARRHAGVVVLHDTGLREFLSSHLRHDEVQVPMLAESGATGATLERARGAVVHSGAAFDQVAALRRCPVVQLELPYAAGRPVVRRGWDGVLRLVVFGYLGSNRRLESLLEAIAGFSERPRLRLDLFGELEHADAVAERIQSLALDDIVTIRGFVSEPELDAALDRSHLAVNLRFPSMGEASASQLRIWNRGLASVVTRTGWYADLPVDAVWQVDPDNETADLHRHFAAALADPDGLQRMGAAGRRYLEARHDPGVYARELAVAIERMVQTPVPVVGEAIGAVSRIFSDAHVIGNAKAAAARRVGEEIARWLRR